MQKSNYIVFDCETGGLDETKNPITQYAAVILDGKTLKEIDRFETFVKPYGDLIIEKQAIEHTMVTMSDVNSGMKLKDFISAVTMWWEGHRTKAKVKEKGRLIPVGHNVTFDLRFLNYALSLEGKPTTEEWMYPNLIDTFSLGKMTWGITGEEKLNLGACCERAKIKLTDAHGAMNDVVATAELFRWYMKKLRAKKGDSNAEETGGRARGQEFFEFKCGAK